MVLRTTNFNILGVHWKIRLLGGGEGSTKNQYRGGDWFKEGGGLWYAIIKGGGLGQFVAGVDTPVHTMIIHLCDGWK